MFDNFAQNSFPLDNVKLCYFDQFIIGDATVLIREQELYIFLRIF